MAVTHADLAIDVTIRPQSHISGEKIGDMRHVFLHSFGSARICIRHRRRGVKNRGDMDICGDGGERFRGNGNEVRVQWRWVVSSCVCSGFNVISGNGNGHMPMPMSVSPSADLLLGHNLIQLITKHSDGGLLSPLLYPGN
ncbi:hypothetical protein KI387_010758 [Taxus chinensis]|uniref:Uncharacterized protein n=1 Tax=Taxus chinensis TaxID=29808 RepID=A0AA38FLK4_TAXCH|nr:hypothetical protein KI387_010758 [Taxus chinensis]